jgi:hypothetical protein
MPHAVSFREGRHTSYWSASAEAEANPARQIQGCQKYFTHYRLVRTTTILDDRLMPSFRQQ